MSYPITHLRVAQGLAGLMPDTVTDLPQFYLGVLGPDAVHFREGFTGDDKKHTHLCVYETGWGLWISEADDRDG